MGCVNSTQKEGSLEKTASDKVDDYLKEESMRDLLNYKVLLLGAGESGKSTVVKQLKVIYKSEIDQEELNNYKINLHNNTLTSMQVFIEAAERLKLVEWQEDEESIANSVKNYVFDDSKLMPREIGEAISKLWKSSTIKNAYAQRATFWHLDAADYYFDNVERFVEQDYVPTEEDCIMARVRTTGIVLTEFDDHPVHFRVMDVAGQRSERKKWMHCFDDVKSLVFVVSLAGYNQVLFEDATHNRMKEALNLFNQIANHPMFEETPIFLFLNKKDLFEKMIQEVDLSKCFPDYTGGNDVKSALDFVQAEFLKGVERNSNRLHTYIVAARYKRDIKYAWEDIKKILVNSNMKDYKKGTTFLKEKEKDKVKGKTEKSNGKKK